MLIQRQVDRYLNDLGDLGIKDLRSIIKFYVSMAVACMLLKKTSIPTDKELAGLLPIALKQIDESKILTEAIAQVINTYAELGKTETVAKGPEMREKVLAKMAAIIANSVGSLGI
jgi:hypothetical protein